MLEGIYQGAPVGTGFFNDAVGGAVVDLASDAVDVVIPPTVLYMHLVNTTAAVAYLQVFVDKAANITLGTTAPAWTFRLAANESRDIPFPWCLGGAKLALSIAGTTTASGAVGANISVQALYAFL